MDQLIALFDAYAPLSLAGAAGGIIRWWTVEKDWRLILADWPRGLGHTVAGGIAGTYLGAAFFAIIRPAADFSGMSAQDGQLLGAHLAGVVGINLYAILPELFRAWVRHQVEQKP